MTFTKIPDFPGLEIEIINSMTFQVFYDLYKPCTYYSIALEMFYKRTSLIHMYGVRKESDTTIYEMFT